VLALEATKMFEYSLGSIKRGIRKSYFSHNYTPTDAIIFLTYRCTSRCSACNMWQRPVDPSSELSWTEWKPILQNLKHNNIKNIELFGGDALLRKELLLNMISFCDQNNIGTFFPTNSSSLTDKTIQALVDAGLGTIYLSFDEVPELDGSIRGVKRHYERVIKSIEKIRHYRGSSTKPRISCITTVSPLNYAFLKNLTQTIYDAGADEHMIRGMSEFTSELVDKTNVQGIKPSPYFMSTTKGSHAFTDAQAEEFLKILDDIWLTRHRFFPMSIDMCNLRGVVDKDHLTDLSYPYQSCVFATTQVVISPYGNVLPCLYFKNYHLGNLTRNDLKVIWGNQTHRLFCTQQQSNKIPLCDKCSIKFYHKPFLPTVHEVLRNGLEKMIHISKTH